MIRVSGFFFSQSTAVLLSHEGLSMKGIFQEAVSPGYLAQGGECAALEPHHRQGRTTINHQLCRRGPEQAKTNTHGESSRGA